jgi:UDP-arabinose 4-epimerase
LTINLGTGRAHSILEVIDPVERVVGAPVNVEWAARRPGDPPTLVADRTQARALLKFEPRYSELDTIIKTAWQSRTPRFASSER